MEQSSAAGTLSSLKRFNLPMQGAECLASPEARHQAGFRHRARKRSPIGPLDRPVTPGNRVDTRDTVDNGLLAWLKSKMDWSTFLAVRPILARQLVTRRVPESWPRAATETSPRATSTSTHRVLRSSRGIGVDIDAWSRMHG